MKRKLRRGQVLEFFARRNPCLVGMEACAGGAFLGFRELTALGHEVRIMPPSYVKPYVKRGKTDAADRARSDLRGGSLGPTMRFVPVNLGFERQAALLDHKTRDFLVRQRTQLVNTIRAHLSEFGIVAAKGIHNVERLLTAAGDLPDAARPAVDLLAEQLRQTQEKIETVTTELEAAQKDDPLARRLATIPGVGTITASAIAATTPEVDTFRSPRPTTPPGSGSRHSRTRAAEGTAGQDLQGWQPVSAPAPLPWCDGADQRAPQGRTRHGLALARCCRESRSRSSPSRSQPHGAGRLGADPDRRELPGQPGLTGHAGRSRPAPRR